MGPDINERTADVIQEIHGKQFMQPEIIRCTNRMAKKPRNRSDAARYND